MMVNMCEEKKILLDLEKNIIEIEISSDIKKKDKSENIFELINSIIEVKHYLKINNLYSDIKKWIKYYLLILEERSFNYDIFNYNKIEKKINYLESLDEKISITKYIIRLLKKFHRTGDIKKFIKLRRKFELINAITREGSFIKLSYSLFSYNIFTLLTTILLSIIIFSYIWLISQENYNLISITLLQFSKEYIFINYVYNFLCIVFNLNLTLTLDSQLEIIYFSLIKIYFFIIITYYIIKEIAMRIED